MFLHALYGERFLEATLPTLQDYQDRGAEAFVLNLWHASGLDPGLEDHAIATHRTVVLAKSVIELATKAAVGLAEKHGVPGSLSEP